MFLPGDLLLAEPYISDPRFFRAVIMLCSHQPGGSFGFVLNQKSEMLLSDVSERFEGFDIPLFIGGPVDHNILNYIHTLSEISGSTPLRKGFFLGGDIEELLEKIRLGLADAAQTRFFLGYSGWGEGQLETEYAHAAWLHITQYDASIFEVVPKDLWRTILRQQDGSLRQFAHYPEDPRLN